MSIPTSADPFAPGHRGFRRFVCMLALPGLLAGCEAPRGSSPTLQGPTELLEAWVEMWNSYDLDRVHTLFLDDARLSYFSSEREGVIRGMAALVEHHRGFGFISGGQERGSRLWLEELHIDPFGDAAVATAIWFFQSEAVAPGAAQRGPVTFVCVRESGEWRFAHMNFSEYLPADSI